MSVNVSVRLSDDVVQRLDAAAAAQGRTRSNLISFLIEQGLPDPSSTPVWDSAEFARNADAVRKATDKPPVVPGQMDVDEVIALAQEEGPAAPVSGGGEAPAPRPAKPVSEMSETEVVTAITGIEPPHPPKKPCSRPLPKGTWCTKCEQVH